MHARSYHHGDLRAALLTRAEETLREKGAEALSLRELARDLGVSHAAPSRHFKDRRALLDALALSGFDRLTAALEKAAPAGGTFRERLTAQAWACVDFTVREAEMMTVMFSRKLEQSEAAANSGSGNGSGNGSGSGSGDEFDPAPHEDIHAAWMRLSAPVLAVIADGQRSGDVHEGDVERIAMSVFIVVHGVSSLTMANMLHADEVWTALGDAVDNLVRGLKPGA